MPRVSVVIPNWNGIPHLPECLATLGIQSFRDFEVVLVDNSSTDDSVAWVRQHHPETRVLELDENGGFSKAVNAGIRDCQAEYVALLNNDTAVEADWLDALVRALDAHPGYDFAASKMVLYHRPEVLNAAGDVYVLARFAGKNRGIGHPAVKFEKMERVWGACAGAALYRRALFNQVGLFDEVFFLSAEDTDFNLRCLIAGKRCLYVPGAVVRHKHRATVKTLDATTMGLMVAWNEAFVAARDLPAVVLPFLPAFWGYRVLRRTVLMRPSGWHRLPGLLRSQPSLVLAELRGMIAGGRRRPEVWKYRAAGMMALLRWLLVGSGPV